MKNFYKKLESEIKNFIINKELDKALKLIEEELSMPYIPVDLEEFLKEKHNEITNLLFDDKNTITIEKIINILMEDIKTIDKYDLSNNLNEYNLSKYLTEMKKILILEDEILRPDVKRNILLMMSNQGIEGNIEYREAKEAKVVELSKVNSYIDDKEFIEISSIIEKYLFNNQVSLNMALNILESIFLKKIFDSESIDLDNAGISIVLLTLKILQDEERIKEILKTIDFDVNIILENIEKYIN